MKSKIVNTPPVEIATGYPYIGKLKATKYREKGDEDLTVLFIRAGVGIVLIGCPSRPIGEYSENYSESLFEPLSQDKSITLSN